MNSKGYSLNEFLDQMGISLSTYRRWEKETSQFNGALNEWIDEAPKKGVK